MLISVKRGPARAREEELGGKSAGGKGRYRNSRRGISRRSAFQVVFLQVLRKRDRTGAARESH